MRLKNKRILVYGLGSSGKSVILQLLKLKSKIFLLDASLDKLTKLLNEYHLYIFDSLDNIDMIIVSPGIRKDDKILVEAMARSIPIISELEFGYLLNKKSYFIAVTGTNGKTTTVNMLYSMVKEYKEECYLLGNIGTPLSSISNVKSNIIVEVSSFQLEYIDRFRPKVAVILNLAPDHLDRYNSEQEYYQYKKRIIENSQNDYLVVNFDDINLKDFQPKNCTIYYFSLNTFVSKGAYLYNNNIYFSDGGSSELILGIQELNVIGIHNIANAMASIVVARLLKVPTNIIKNTLCAFRGLEHRFELVCMRDGIVVINDSKATNVASTLSAYDSIVNGSYLILGGSDKGESFDKLFANDKQKYHYCIYGATAFKILESAQKYNKQSECILFDTLFDATEYALKSANKGNMVVLSPACASFDSFLNYEDRGQQFKEFVRAYYEK